jgi:hypothetical protein
MPVFDFFKKSNKKESPKSITIGGAEKSAKDNPLFSPELQKKRYDAAMEFMKIFQEKIPLVDGKPHPGTVLSVAARLAGTSLYRSINKKDVAPGVVVLSEEVNQAYPSLFNLFAFYCNQHGLDVTAKPLVTKFPEGDKPLMELSQVQAEYQDQYDEIMKNHGLDYLEGARAGAIVCSIVFHYHCISSKDIDPYVAAGIVAMGVVEGAKTSPVLLKSADLSAKSSSGTKENKATELIRTIANTSISGSGKRLVLGEGMTSMKEALDNGGKYILVNPGVVSKLKEGNIDPFLVYEAALLMEVEAKIPQIDFVGGSVDQLAQQWSGKPQGQIPVHVRQIMWLKENAGKYGYQQNGNSWKLK